MPIASETKAFKNPLSNVTAGSAKTNANIHPKDHVGASSSADSGEEVNRSKRKSSVGSPTEGVRKVKPTLQMSLAPRLPEGTSDSTKTTTIIQRPSPILPDHKTSGIDPDSYLIELVEALWGIKVKIQKASCLDDFFSAVTDQQMANYSINVVSLARDNKVAELREYYQGKGIEALDCYNRFGEGLLNLTCRRGFSEMTNFLLSEVGLSVRVRDDYGRTPLHDTCWNAEPQLDIAKWIVERDPSLFLVADRRGYSPFQYARKSDWAVWRKFLFDNRHCLQALANPDLRTRFEDVTSS